MIDNYQLSGVIPIVPTPFNENEEVDEEALRALIDFAIRGGLKAVCLPAYASEFYKLTDEERQLLVKIAVEQSAGRIKIMAQSNHGSLKQAIAIAQSNVEAGTDMISIAVPRIFSLPESSIYAYLDGFLGALQGTPVLIQDFNPGGQSISTQLIETLWKKHKNFQGVKLEEPLCAPKFKEIIRVTKGEIAVFEGWGGIYTLELVPVGIAGIMPGLGVADILQLVFDFRRNGDNESAFELFGKVLPQILFSLQNMELFHYAEKELLMARGVLKNSITRKPSYIPDPSSISYIKELNDVIVKLIQEIQ